MAATKILHVRLDAESRRVLEHVRRRTGLDTSEVLRRALRALDDALPELPAREPRTRVVGLGKFRSGLPDLGSNRQHLRGLGRS